MSMIDWAKREIELACKHERGDRQDTEWDYGCACYDSAYKAFLSLMEDGHSGMSIGFTQNILNRLIDGKPLTPIEDTLDIWEEVTHCDTYRTFQCTRMSSLFKDIYPDGRIKYYETSRCYCVNRDDIDAPSWTSNFINKIIDEMYPVTMPYYPAALPYVVYCTEGLSDPKNGDFDTIGVWYVVKPDGERDTIERFFKETPVGMTEIDRDEYFDRVNRVELAATAEGMSNG